MTLESLYLPDLLDGVTLEAGARGLRAIRFGARQLREYMAGERSEFDIPLDPVGTPFQLEVWKALAEIPYGSTRSYHYIAIAVNRPKGFHPWAATVADSRANKRFCNWRDNMLSDSEKQQLEQHGYLLLPGFMSPEEVAAFNARVEELFAEEGDGAGSEFKSEPGARRIANAVNKGEIFEKVIETPKVLECMEAVLGPDFKLSSLNIRSANP